MYVHELNLTNVRQFQKRQFAFQPGFNLLVGENGAGKTTLLRALITVLGGAGQVMRRAALIDEDIRLRARQLEIVAVVAGGSKKPYALFSYKKTWGRRASRSPVGATLPLLLVYGSNEATCTSFIAQRIRHYSREAPPPSDASDEAWLHEADTEEGTAPDQTTRFGRSQAVREFVVRVLSRFSPKFRSFSWTFEPYGCSIRRKARNARDDFRGYQWRSELSRQIMRYLQESERPFRTADQSRVLIDSDGYLMGARKHRERATPSFRELLSGSKEGHEVREKLESFVAEIRLTPRILVRTGGEDFKLSQLSDGEKRLFSLFVDIARQLSIQREPIQFRDVAAIVVIDEIDVHLHPKWQRLVVPALEDLFPACQFIATTHSPFVVQGVPEHKVQHLNHSLPGAFTDRGIEEITAKVMGIEDHQVGPRYLEMLDTAKEYFQLLEQGRKSRASGAELKRLKDKLAELSPRYARNPAYQAYLELHGIIALGPGTTDETSK